MHILLAGHDIADLALVQHTVRHIARREVADVQHLKFGLGAFEEHLVAFVDVAIHRADVGDTAAVRIHDRVEDQRAGNRLTLDSCTLRWSNGSAHAVDDGIQHFGYSPALFGRDQENLFALAAEQFHHFFTDALGICRRQVNFIQDGNQLQIVLKRHVKHRKRLGLDALRGIDEQDRAFARSERPADFITKISVAGRVDEIQLMTFVLHAHRLQFDGDTALALQIHHVERLLLHLTFLKRSGHFDHPVRQRRLSMIDMRDDAKVSDWHWGAQILSENTLLRESSMPAFGPSRS